MSKLKHRIVGCLLVSCLIVDPAWSTSRPAPAITSGEKFKIEALTARPRWFIHILGDSLDSLKNLFDATRYGIADEHRVKERDAIFRLAYRYLLHYASTQGERAARSADAEAQIRLEAKGILGVPSQQVHKNGLVAVAALWTAFGIGGWLAFSSITALAISLLSASAILKHLKPAYAKEINEWPFPNAIRRGLESLGLLPQPDRRHEKVLENAVARWNRNHSFDRRISHVLLDPTVSMIAVTASGAIKVNPTYLSHLSERDIADLLESHESVHLTPWAQLRAIADPHTRWQQKANAAILILNEIPAYAWYGFWSPFLALKSMADMTVNVWAAKEFAKSTWGILLPSHNSHLTRQSS